MLRRSGSLKYTLLASVSALVMSVGACSGKKSSTEKVGPPSLFIESIQNASGDEFSKDDAVKLACDSRFTVRVGPSEVTSGLLDNWVFRPPGTCGTLVQCGFVRLSLLNSGDVVSTYERASLNLVVEEPPETLETIDKISVELISSVDGSNFLVDGVSVTDNWNVSFLADGGCDTSVGGAGGAGGTTSMGGDFGLGGIGGAP